MSSREQSPPVNLGKRVCPWDQHRHTELAIGALNQVLIRAPPTTLSPSPPPRWVPDGQLVLQDHESLLRKGFYTLYPARELPRQEAASIFHLTIKVHHRISQTPNKPQYELSSQFLGSNANLFHPISTVFELPDELILLILSYISPEPKITDHHTRFRGQYGMEINGDHGRRVQFLRPLSMTCRRMRLRLMPWIWERIEASPRRNWSSGEDFSGRVSSIANALHADTSLATSVK